MVSTRLSPCESYRASHLVFAWIAAPIVVFAGVPRCGDFEECVEPSTATLAALPAQLSDAGLVSDMKTQALHDRVWAYQPGHRAVACLSRFFSVF